jgi:hypothetical protein
MFKSEFWRWPDFGDLEPLQLDAPMRDRLERGEGNGPGSETQEARRAAG